MTTVDIMAIPIMSVIRRRIQIIVYKIMQLVARRFLMALI